MEKELGLLRLLVEWQMCHDSSRNMHFISAAAIKVSQRLERMGFEKRLIDPFTMPISYGYKLKNGWRISFLLARKESFMRQVFMRPDRSS